MTFGNSSLMSNQSSGDPDRYFDTYPNRTSKLAVQFSGSSIITAV